MRIHSFVKGLIVATTVALTACCGNGSKSIFNIADYGADSADGVDNAAAIQKAIDACADAGGGSVVIPAGRTFMTGPLHLRSNVDLHLEPGSRLLANPDESIYTESAFGENRGEGMMWLIGKDLEGVSITGTGTIDGNGVAFMGAELEDSYELKPVTTFDPRPHVLTLINCKKINIRDVTITGSAYWTMHLVGCYDAAISDISLLNNLKIRNGDGIDLDHSRKVRITGCFIESGDDCICLKNRREYEEYGPCRDIVVTNCIMTSRSCAVKIGSENMDSIDHVLFDNCIIRNSNRGIGIQNRDEGTVSDVTFANMSVECLLHSDVWWGKAEPIYVTSYPRAPGNHKDAGWRFPKGAISGSCGPVSRIKFVNISCESENGCFIGGETPDKITDITFDRVDIRLNKFTAWPGGVYDKRPCDGEGFVNAPVYGFYIDTASDITFNDCRINASNLGTEPFGGDYKLLNVTGVTTR
ncbi:MAG: right-handed parallel beta-helix repeat-containing protein [Muribaculaceae bacterium]|nr:right-handed parallel beta-helix repeat-containing protein [Muribaculaceae bacterium]